MLNNNIASFVQTEIANLLETNLSAYQARFIPENSLDIEYEVKAALAKQGCAGIVTLQNAVYQGHNNVGPAYDIVVQLQLAENPTLHRAQLKRANLSSGTGLDIALSADQIIADVSGDRFGQYCLQDTTQALQGGLVVTTSTYKGFGCYINNQPSEKWTAEGEFAGEYIFQRKDGEAKIYKGPGDTTFTTQPQGSLGWQFILKTPATEYNYGTIGEDMPTTVVFANTTFTYNE